jgi:hypothetical protein
MKNKNSNSLLDLMYGIEARPPAGPLSRLLNLTDPMPTPAPVFPAIEKSLFGSLIGAPSSPVPLSSLAIGTPLTLPPPPAMPLVPWTSPVGIQFSNVVFSEPKPFGEWMPYAAGIYAILVMDFRQSPRPFRPLYFGIAENLAERVTTSHENYDKWIRCAGLTGIYVSHHRMERSSMAQRMYLEKSLIKTYAPECNDIHNPILRRLDY